MTAPARLLALRVQGFKSFGERTLVEFGPGISAVVGPNGSGKSNLADALRWALGEQGRALRLRRSEDVIFAGSEKRSALGMADVQLVLDNSDRLLNVDFETVEFGRRLYRSGENDYLLNRQRVRLKDLIELLDAAHLADNAFLFIGQGMVDQALALRPEERRPLFEEVAGVRRHERRKAKAEEQLAEAEANLARVEDVVAELRPQVRRLAAQAEQQASRQTAGREYGRAVLAAARARWHAAAARARDAEERLTAGRADAESALAALRDAEERASAIARELATRSQAETDRRAAHEAARAALTELQLAGARAGSDAESAARDRRRIDADLAAAESDLEAQRRAIAAPVPARDLALAAAVAEADRSLAEALEELGALRASRQARGEALAALRRAEAARTAELETARRRLADAARQASEERSLADETTRRLTAAEAAMTERRAAQAAATEAERRAAAAREAARAALDEREGERQAAADRTAAASSRAAGLRGRLDALRARLADEEARGIAKAARRAGGQLVGDGLQVDSGLRPAVEAALGEAVRGYVVPTSAVSGLAAERGTLVVEPGADQRPGTGRGARGDRRDEERASAAAVLAIDAGGGRLADAIRTDPTGAATRLLERALWVPDLTSAVAIGAALPAGWLVATREGAVVTDAGVVSLGRGESLLERRAEVERLTGEVDRLVSDASHAAAAAAGAAGAAAEARRALDAAREAERSAGAARRAADDDERKASRSVEALAREAAWHAAQLVRLEAERDRLAAAVEAGRATAVGSTETATTESAGGNAEADAGAIREWEARAAVLRGRRDELAAEEARGEAVRREAESRRARAAAAAALDEERIVRLEREAAELAERERSLAGERERLGEALASAAILEAGARSELDALRAAEAETRGRLGEAESAATAARERLRAAQERTRSAEVAELEARMGLEAIKEQVLVELAGLGDLGMRLLLDEAGEELRGAGEELGSRASLASGPGRAEWTAAGADGTNGTYGAEAAEETALEEALAAAAARWATEPPQEAPQQARLASLRRRFHDLGAANPFAAEEYQATKARLDALETQRTDLHAAIGRTRALIEQLNSMISTQFRDTFRALETAFDARFRQLFGGGFARLSLTEPDDLAATGVEIVARPPGKKAQPLGMLSGGERALTAVALLFAMLEVHPVPFCVLDEVDAALDEANVGRFAEALRSLAGQTQFIVITHNRGTIESADALYGVTVGDDAVSRIISLRLEEARELADKVSRRDALGAAPSAS